MIDFKLIYRISRPVIKNQDFILAVIVNDKFILNQQIVRDMGDFAGTLSEFKKVGVEFSFGIKF